MELPNELQSASVAHRIAELGHVARSLRWERLRAARADRPRRLRIALGRRLMSLGAALIEGGAGARWTATTR